MVANKFRACVSLNKLNEKVMETSQQQDTLNVADDWQAETKLEHSSNWTLSWSTLTKKRDSTVDEGWSEEPLVIQIHNLI